MSQVDEDQPLCISCGAELPPDKHFCAACGAPSDAFAVTAPFETIRARAWSYGAAQRPRNGLVVLGAWLIFGPLFFGSCYGLLISLMGMMEVLTNRAQGDRTERVFILLILCLSGFTTYVIGGYLWRTTRYYFQHRRDPPPANDDEDEADDA